MKKILGLAVLMMVMLISVSGLADSVNVPLYLNVDPFVSIEVTETDQRFDWEIDFATGEATLTDCVTLEVSANVSYTITPTIDIREENVTTEWNSILDETVGDGDGIEVVLKYQGEEGYVIFTSGTPGITYIDAHASLEGYNLNDVVHLQTLLSAGDLNNQKVAEITFTISSVPTPPPASPSPP